VETVAPDREILELVKESGGETFRLCFQCGLCDALCPWNRVARFSIRRLLREGAFGLTEIESEDVWRCTTCGRCQKECPRGVKQIEFVTSLRRIAVEFDVFPKTAVPVRVVRGSLVGEGNPLNEARAKRADWAKGLSVKSFSEGTELLYFPGCYLCYDPRLKKVAAATVKILEKAGLDFGILGTEENCCGESVRKAGFEDLFKSLAKENIKSFIDNGVKRILVSSPHCYHTFRNEYPDFRVNFKVIHIVQLLSELMEDGFRLSGEFKKKVVWHDPCYLGRHNGMFEEPRRILRAIRGLELLEFPESGAEALCCGGGGGRIWMETPKGERFSDIRVEQAVEVGAEVLVTSCPYCITNFEDSRLTLGLEGRIEIKDITEVVSEVL